MKNKSLHTILEWALITSLLFSAYFFVNYYFKSKQQREFNNQLLNFQRNNSFLNTVVADCIEYGKHNPAINPLLESFGIPKTALGAAAAPKPPAAPAK